MVELVHHRLESKFSSEFLVKIFPHLDRFFLILMNKDKSRPKYLSKYEFFINILIKNLLKILIKILFVA